MNHGVRIWDEWADDKRQFESCIWKTMEKLEAPDGKVIDQISDLIHTLKTNPSSREDD